MSNDTGGTDRAGRTAGALGTAVRTVFRLFGDLLAVSLWVLFLSLLFLETGWPRWLFYALLVVGVGVYVAVTAAWTE